MSKPNYKTTRLYKCPYCNYKAQRAALVDHAESKHEDMIPENYTAARAVYDFINGKNYGICMICHEKVFEWNDKINRYYNLCNKAECRAKVREIALERHMRVYNKPTLLNDPEQQEKMLANRKISGTYTFTDGGKITYTGQYEKKALEFIDKVLEIPSNDIQAPGPVLEYEYNGETHKWITDIYYIPGNLLIEVKDGGSNPNNRSMESYREKQIAKEKMVTDMGTYNYIRLTDNNFAQLLDILADMKNEALTEENPKMKIHINEEVGGLPPHHPPEAYIVPYGMNNVFAGYAYSDSMSDTIFYTDEDNNILPMIESEFKEKYTTGPRLYFTGDNISDIVKNARKYINETPKCKTCLEFMENIIGRKLHTFEEVILSSNFKYLDEEREKKICHFLENAATIGFEDNSIIDSKGCVSICLSPNGYYACTPSNFYMASDYFSDVESLKTSGVIDLMNDIYKSNANRGEVEEDE